MNITFHLFGGFPSTPSNVSAEVAKEFLARCEVSSATWDLSNTHGDFFVAPLGDFIPTNWELKYPKKKVTT